MRRAVLDSSAEDFGRARPPRPWLSVVIPAFNQERRLPATLERVLNYLRPRGDPFEVIVVDDGSSDGTCAVARAAGPEVRVVEIPHTGKGGAVRSGVLASTGELILVTDADLPTPIDDLRQLIVAVESGSGLAVGSRRMESSSIDFERPIHRRVMGKVFSLRGVHDDTQCGFKLFKGELAREVFSLARVAGFAFDVEAILLARQLGARVSEVPVNWYDPPQGHVRAVRDSLAMFVDLLAIRRLARGARRLPTALAVLRGGRPAAPQTETAGGSPELARVFWLALAAYLAVAAFLVLHEHLIARDAYSRVASAHRILFSHDPHLGAIFFVWSPLPILAMLPLIPFKMVWPDLTVDGFAASIVSAFCMAAAAREIYATLREMGVGGRVRLLLTLSFAAHPMVVLYGANGMSEAMFLLFLLMATRRLATWLRREDLGAGTGAALALAAAYLARYEALVAGAIAVCLVTAVSYRRGGGEPWERVSRALCDATLIGAPIVATFVLWILAGWVITGNAMEQFSSAYGNSAQLRVGAGSAAPDTGGWAAYAMRQVLILEPFLVAVIAIASIGTWKALNAATLAAMGLVGGVLAFMFWSNATGAIDHELRYMILAIPVSILAAGAVFSGSAAAASAQPRKPRFGLTGPGSGADGIGLYRSLRAPAGVVTLLMVAAALPVSAFEMTNPGLNPADSSQLRAIYENQGGTRQATVPFVTERKMAVDLDALNLPPHTVLVDDFLGFPLPLNSRNPTQFVITSDRDFKTVLSDPVGAGIQYVLVPEPVKLGQLDAVNREYPKLYANGGGMASEVKEYTSVDDPTQSHWRLYRLNPEAMP